jgi:hypothetical protein
VTPTDPRLAAAAIRSSAARSKWWSNAAAIRLLQHGGVSGTLSVHLAELTMRVAFWSYLTVIAVGLAYFIAVGLLHR